MVNWTPEADIKFPGVDVVRVVFRIVDVLFRAVDSETFFRDLSSAFSTEQ
jgi:hypothetical protein